MVRAFGREVTAGGRDSLNLRMMAGSIQDGPYRLRSASDAAWPGYSAAYSHRETFWDRILIAFGVVLSMILPVLALLASFVGLYLYRDTPASIFLGSIAGSWLTLGHLLVPVGFLCVHLTNRRYGPAFAFAQVVIATALVAGTVIFAGDKIRPFIPVDTMPSMREALAFGTAFFVSSFISIVAFEGARGAHWWTAPLFGFVSAAIFFAAVFYPAAYYGTSGLWLHQGLLYMGLLAGEGIMLLIPYWMLRRMVPPLSGFGGY